MKALWIILLSLALAWSPAALSRPSAAGASPCKHCNCGGAGCCVDETPATPAPAPAAPLPSLASGHDLALLFPVLEVFSLSDPRPMESGAAFCPVPCLPAVALHARHCCFLI